jgi:hypothetical protein
VRSQSSKSRQRSKKTICWLLATEADERDLTQGSGDGGRDCRFQIGDFREASFQHSAVGFQPEEGHVHAEPWTWHPADGWATRPGISPRRHEGHGAACGARPSGLLGREKLSAVSQAKKRSRAEAPRRGEPKGWPDVQGLPLRSRRLGVRIEHWRASRQWHRPRGRADGGVGPTFLSSAWPAFSAVRSAAPPSP